MNKRIIALYLRLSHRDAEIDEGKESNSIGNQRALLWEYVRQNKEFLHSISDLEQFEIREFVDDGYSGVNFERSAVKTLLELAKEGQVYCILVKDLSRFGRNYIEVGTYLEKIFPYIGVRFICVNDTYDSASQNNHVPGIEMSFKGIIHDYYCKELSRKAKLARRQQVEKGRCVMAKPPYGYWKSDSEKGKLVIDEESATIVSLIFDMFLSGMSTYQIARTLNEKGVASPNKRLEKKGMITFEKEYSEGLCWGTHAVLAILKSEIYIGNMVGNKCAREKIASKSCKRLDEEQWIVVKGTHEPIVSAEVFEQVQLIMQERKPQNSKRENTEYLFRGKLVCGRCHSVLVRSGGNKGNIYYACNKCRQSSSQNTTIVHSVDLRQEIWEGILKRNENCIIDREREREGIDKKHLIDRIEELMHFIEGKQKKFPLLYERYADGKITREHFLEERESINKAMEELEVLERDYQILHKEQPKMMFEKEETGEWELSNCMVAEYVDKITVFGRNEFEITWVDAKA